MDKPEPERVELLMQSDDMHSVIALAFLAGMVTNNPSFATRLTETADKETLYKAQYLYVDAIEKMQTLIESLGDIETPPDTDPYPDDTLHGHYM